LRIRALVLFALVAIACKDRQQNQREEALKGHLAQMRQAIASYKADRGQYPPTLAALVPIYLRTIPSDPITESSDWRVTTEETVQPSTDFQTTTIAPTSSVVIDVHSSAPGADRNGVPYANY